MKKKFTHQSVLVSKEFMQLARELITQTWRASEITKDYVKYSNKEKTGDPTHF